MPICMLFLLYFTYPIPYIPAHTRLSAHMLDYAETLRRALSILAMGGCGAVSLFSRARREYISEEIIFSDPPASPESAW